MFVAREKFAQLERLSRVPRTHEHDVAQSTIDKLEAAQNEGPHENFAEFGVSSDQRAQPVCAEFEEVARLSHTAAGKTSPAGNHRHVARESTGPVSGDGALSGERRLHDFHGARK